MKKTGKRSGMTKLAIIGGSGAHKILARGALGASPEKVTPKKTPFGKAPDLWKYDFGGMDVLFLPRHGKDGYQIAAPFINYRANIWALKELGVERIISWSGPGVINPEFEVGAYAVPDDIIDQTRNRPTTFFEKGGLGFIRMSDPFCPDLRHSLIYSMSALDHVFYEKSVYCCTEGPRLETPAEIRLYHSYGADLVGMTLVPEAFLAREMEMCYASLCYLTNFAEGIAPRKFESGALFEGMATEEEMSAADRAAEQMPEIILGALRVASDHPRDCECKNAMLRYKKRGNITEDWRTWINP